VQEHVSPTELARQQWAEGHRRLQEELRTSTAARERLLGHVEIVGDQLRRRIGRTFTLAELAGVYASAEDWSRDAIEETEAATGWARTLALVIDSAFHLYARGAVDYAP
jgi:hypothetical protein